MMSALKQQIEDMGPQSNDLPLLCQEWWKNFSPSLSIAKASSFDIRPLGLDNESVTAIRQLIRQEGYIQGSVGQWGLPLADMVLTVAKLKAGGLLPVFALVYDEFWQLAQQLGPVVSALLGDQYHMLPDFWVWHVDPKRDERGWRPHRDKGYRSLLPDGSPKSVTLWIPLTVSTPLNGCMYIVPADRDPTYGTENDREWKFQHQDVRALPAQPGEFFIWNQAVVHWGSRTSSRGELARVSVAFEFQRGDIPIMNTPLIAPSALLSFEDRMWLIGKQVQQYRHMYVLSDSVQKLVDAMVALAPVSSPSV